MRAERVFPRHSVVEAREAVLRVGGVDRQQKIVRKFERNQASLGVVLGQTESVSDRKRLVLCKNGRAE